MFKYLAIIALSAYTSAEYLYGDNHHNNYVTEYASAYDNYKPKDYKFEYGVSDPHTGDHKSQWEVMENGVVRGAYSLLEADGTTRLVEYYADDTGFHADVKKIGAAVHPQVHSAKPLYAAPVHAGSTYGLGDIAQFTGYGTSGLAVNYAHAPAVLPEHNVVVPQQIYAQQHIETPKVLYHEQPNIHIEQSPKVIYQEQPKVIYQEQPKVLYQEAPQVLYHEQPKIQYSPQLHQLSPAHFEIAPKQISEVLIKKPEVNFKIDVPEHYNIAPQVNYIPEQINYDKYVPQNIQYSAPLAVKQYGPPIQLNHHNIQYAGAPIELKQQEIHYQQPIAAVKQIAPHHNVYYGNELPHPQYASYQPEYPRYYSKQVAYDYNDDYNQHSY